MAKDDEKPEEAKGGGKKKMIMIIVPVLLLVAGGAYFFLLKPAPAAATTALPAPAAGAVVTLDPITVNLAGGHFLKLGMALQPTAAAAATVTGPAALDLAITEFSGMTIDELSTAKGRAQAKAELVARIKLAYLPVGSTIATATTVAPAAGAAPAAAATADTTPDQETAASLSGSKALKLAGQLTVQPDVYDVYFTEFVMQ